MLCTSYGHQTRPNKLFEYVQPTEVPNRQIGPAQHFSFLGTRITQIEILGNLGSFIFLADKILAPIF